MKRIRLTMSYGGTAYFGSRMQPEAVTVEQKLTEAVQRLTRVPAQLTLASRTDTGIHALSNVAVFDTEFPMPAGRFTAVLNAYLPSDIRIQAADEAVLNQHPRKQHYEKTYKCYIWNEHIMNPLFRNSAAHCCMPLNLTVMRATLPSLLGEHDFVTFCASGSAASHTVRRIFRAELTTECEKSDSFTGLITFRIAGSDFSYHMMRTLAGTLLKIGSGKKDATAFQRALRNRARCDTDPVAPAAGLILWEVRYLPVPDRYAADSENWRYEPSQGDLASTEVNRLTIEHCRPDDYAGLTTRPFHESHRNGARYILPRGSEDSTHLVIGQCYGFYKMRKSTSPENGNSFPYLTAKAESSVI